MKVKYLALLGGISLGSIVVLAVFYSDAREETLQFEIAKTLLQLGVVSIAGALISLFASDYQQEQQEKLRALELARQNDEYRKDLLVKTLARVVAAYSNAKKARRLLRARVGTTSNAPGQLILADFDRGMEAVNEAQLELESLKGDVKTSATAFCEARNIEEQLKRMEGYLGSVVKEYEENRYLVAQSNPPIRFDRFKELSDYLGKASKGNGFKDCVVEPYHEVQRAIRNDLLDNTSRN